MPKKIIIHMFINSIFSSLESAVIQDSDPSRLAASNPVPDYQLIYLR